MDRTEQHARRYGSKGAFLGKQKEFKKIEWKSTTNIKLDEPKTKKPKK